MKKIKRKVFSIIATNFFQPFFEKLHYVSLKGMNYGSANSPLNSGELALIKKLKSELPQKAVIFDVGSNNGQYLQLLLNYMKDLNPVIHCFEPDKYAYQKLVARFSKYDNVVLNNFALGAVEETTLLYGKKEGGVDSSLIKPDNENLEEFSVEVKKIDDYCVENNICNIDFMKIDTEGFEMNVLKGAFDMLKKNGIKRIQLEHGSIHSIIAGASLYNYLQ
ncbi:MAG TPA: FkbM family methyltransferase, partial [Flavobacterium sp.]|nr:FkbM family methyltransferase [Flavobacterium sp.]